MERIARSLAVVFGLTLVGYVSPAGAFQTPLKTIRVATGFSRPIFVTSPHTDRNRLFVAEQRGSAGTATRADIRILNLNTLTVNATPFLSVTGVSTGNEEGLLGLAFHPRHMVAGDPNFGAFFIYVTQGGNNIVYRYTTSANPDVANASSQQRVITFNHPNFTNHNGGWIAFGPDGYLYIDTGDGGSGNDPSNNAQNINSYLGKMHRLNVDADQAPADPLFWGYTSPPGNPFVGVAGLDEIYHYGLRNPWRSSFDRLTGDIYIGDVGQNVWEEVDIAPAGVAGLNFGWRCMEASACTGLTGCTCACPGPSNLVCPVAEYNHSLGRCSITGGYVYRGAGICDRRGTYFCADYCGGQIYTMPAGGGALTQITTLSPSDGGFSVNTITSFGEDDLGEVYIVSQNGSIFKIVPNGVPLVGDLNNDGKYTTEDGELLALALVDPAAYAALFPSINPNATGDCNCDGLFNGGDIAQMVWRIVP